MAIPYESKPLPAVTTVDFNVDRWAGVNKIKGAQSDGEMVDCKNMCSDNFPYASPRKSMEKIIFDNVKRIYRVEGDKVYYIDGDDYICYTQKGVKGYVTYTENGADTKIQMSDCICTNNYDKNTVFYPNMQYVNEENKVINISHSFEFGPNQDYISELEVQWMYYLPTYSEYIPIVNTNVKSFKIRAVMTNDESKADSDFAFPYPREGIDVDLGYTVFDKYFNEKKKIRQPVSQKLKRVNVYDFTFPDDLTLKEGDYIRIELFANGSNTDKNSGFIAATLDYIKPAIWSLENAENEPCLFLNPLEYGVIYNNRIVGVSGSDIRASALGDFTNFHEFVDEAGNPSATGAYATDVGSAGDFTGICAYNNVLLLFKKDIVYEMYGSMPYTITELCNTGCIDNDSIVSIDGVLYWASLKGIVRYSGGVPTVISTQVDIKTDNIAKAGTDGRKYYVYDGNRTYVYDTYFKMWHILDELEIKMFYNFENDLYFVADDGIYKINSGNEAVEWEFETKDYTFGSKERKNLSKLWLRADMPKNSRLEVYVKQNGSEWQRVAVKTAEKDEMFDFKLRVKKCDSFALKFKGKGDVRILDIHGKVTVGTSKHRSGLSLNVYRK